MCTCRLVPRLSAHVNVNKKVGVAWDEANVHVEVCMCECKNLCVYGEHMYMCDSRTRLETIKVGMRLDLHMWACMWVFILTACTCIHICGVYVCMMRKQQPYVPVKIWKDVIQSHPLHRMCLWATNSPVTTDKELTFVFPCLCSLCLGTSPPPRSWPELHSHLLHGTCSAPVNDISRSYTSPPLASLPDSAWGDGRQ